MAGMKGVSDNDITRWIFEDSEVEGEFSDEIEHEETLPVCSDISSSESESSDEKESDDNMQPVTSSWKVYHEGDCMGYSVTQQGFTLPQSAQPKTELVYFQLFSSDDLIGKIVTTTNMYEVENITEGDSTNRIHNVALVEGCFVRRNEGILWCNTERGSEFEGAIS
jgi:hypothetical protein